MKKRRTLSFAARLTAGSLAVAAIGVVIQIISGARYPPVPPVFFILLIPAALIAFGRWRWVPAIAVLARLFLTLGLFASGASHRLFSPNQLGDTVGLWIQALAVVVAIVGGVVVILQNYRSRQSV